MAENSGIAWTTHTFNPWVGCTKVGPGCDHCYAEAWNTRFAPDHTAPNWGPGAPRRRTQAKNWGKVRKWNREAAGSDKPVWIFSASLADIFDNEASPGDRADFFDLVAECSNLEFQIVTKRIGNVSKMLPSVVPKNMGLVSTVVTQAECDRDLPKLLAVKRTFGVSWVGLSIEPQLEHVEPRDARGLDWIITGGESDQRGFKARLYDPSWARGLILDGKIKGIPIFVKQMGSRPFGLRLRDSAGAEPGEWPEDLRVREFPAEPFARRGFVLKS